MKYNSIPIEGYKKQSHCAKCNDLFSYAPNQKDQRKICNKCKLLVDGKIKMSG